MAALAPKLTPGTFNSSREVRLPAAVVAADGTHACCVPLPSALLPWCLPSPSVLLPWCLPSPSALLLCCLPQPSVLLAQFCLAQLPHGPATPCPTPCTPQSFLTLTEAETKLIGTLAPYRQHEVTQAPQRCCPMVRQLPAGSICAEMLFLAHLSCLALTHAMAGGHPS